MSDIKIGEKVVCIDDRGWSNFRGTYLVYRNTYTVLDIIVCEKCGGICYDIGAKYEEGTTYTNCCNQPMAGKGIHWANGKRFVPAIASFKDYCRKEVVEHMQQDIQKLIKDGEYEKAIETIKRMEKIHEEL